MAYRSELHGTGGGINMILSREAVTDYGFVLPTMLALVIFRRRSDATASDTELILPDKIQTAMVAASRLDCDSETAPSYPLESIETESLDEFTKRVISRGKEIIVVDGLVPVDGDMAHESLTDQEVEAVYRINRGLLEKPDDRPYPTGLYL